MPTRIHTGLLLCLALVATLVLLAASPASAQPGGDDFDDGIVDPAWGSDRARGNGMLDEVNQRLEFTVDTATADDGASRPWQQSYGPYDADWEVQLDVFDDTTPGENDEVTSIGIDVFSAKDFKHEFFAEIYTSHLSMPPLRSGFHAELLTNGVVVAPVADSGGIGVTSGAVRIAFDAASKVLTAWYDVDPANGYAWVEFASYGVAGAGGTTGNADFGMGDADRFVVSVYGYGASMTVDSGRMYADDFVTTGMRPFPTTTTTVVTTTTTSTTTSTTLPSCGPLPRPGCRRPAAGGAAVTLKDPSDADRDALTWNWRKGAATTKADFGDPADTTTYRLCMYDGGGLRLDAIAPAGGTCGRKACWKEGGHGYRYRDKARSPDGILRLVLHDGAEGKAKLSVAAKGAALEPPPPPLALPVTLQLVRDDGGACWEATFVTARKNVAGRFKARSE